MIVKSPILFDYIKNVHYLNYCLAGVEWSATFHAGAASKCFWLIYLLYFCVCFRCNF